MVAMNEEKAKRATTKFVARCCDAPAGLPFHGSPSCSSFPIVFSSIECDADGPTSLNRGEGHLVSFSSMVGSERGSEVVQMVMG